MGITKSGEIQYRSFSSKCTGCSLFLGNYKCWHHNYVPFNVWQNCFGYECEHFKSNIKIDSGSYVFRDYGDRELFPEKVFGGGKFKFDKDGNKI